MVFDLWLKKSMQLWPIMENSSPFEKFSINQLMRMLNGPENLDFLLLPDPMSSGNGLEIVLRVKVTVEYDDSEKIKKLELINQRE